MTRSPADPAAVHPLPSPKERRRLREAKSLSEEQVATAVGVTRATVRAWETGRSSPRGRKREAYARLIGGGRTGPQAPPPNTRTKTAPAKTRPKAAAKRAARPTSPTTVGRLPKPVVSTKPGPSAQPSSGPPNPVEATGSTAMAPTEPGTTPDLPGTPTTRRAPAIKRVSVTKRTSTTGRASLTKRASGTKGASAAPPAAPRTPAAPPSAPVMPVASPAPAAAPEDGTDRDGTVGHRTDGDRPDGLSPTEAFDALYRHCAEALFRQAFLLTGRRALARESVAQAFALAWDRWPEVAVDRDPVGWVRAATYEYAVSPWHRLRRAHRRPDPPQAEPGARALLDALLALPPSYRRTLLLHDGVGLDLPDTAAETEASTPAAASRLMNARAAIAERLSAPTEDPTTDAASDAGSGQFGAEAFADRPALLHEQLGALALAQPCGSLLPPAVVREGSERKAQLWTRAAVSFTVLIIGLTLFTLATATARYEAPASPARQVDGVPPRSGPEKLTPQDLKLRKKLHGELVRGPARLVPGAG
ncbi:sigma factor-like helix-turn-helix DNA-binding protein [Streptomyces sp. ML-6]|uniref:sigma factor-like helix-turn-helix DNA-binding protein n=1 Tax=Streptomyces sp. ML-6 TaxID=2982693 RepID=UPI0024BFB521|nr:sigma factor-like helix-turn-helix DNA-binding protein [Streptomyces sp. ML-6]MDK0521644.1 helix-turn-helix domain-containing protein [Streptomyces sp. ML-6]